MRRAMWSVWQVVPGGALLWMLVLTTTVTGGLAVAKGCKSIAVGAFDPPIATATAAALRTPDASYEAQEARRDRLMSKLEAKVGEWR